MPTLLSGTMYYLIPISNVGSFVRGASRYNKRAKPLLAPPISIVCHSLGYAVCLNIF